jgi:N-acetylmuramate 1-kinase
MTIAISQTIVCNSHIETEKLAQMLSLWAKPGQVITLQGELGSGKSTFARAFIKALAKPDDIFDVPSPSFSLVQLYDNTRVPVAHIDLYRLSAAQEVEDLGLSELLAQHIVLIEWPERMARVLAASTLTLNFSGSGEVREITMEARGSWTEALNRNETIKKFLSLHNYENIERVFFEGDASSRRYEKLHKDGKQVLLMDMPQRPDGPIVKYGKPYSQIAHLAENIKSVICVNGLLHLLGGYSTPKTLGFDYTNGLAVIEDLGSDVFGKMLLAGEDMTEPMLAAVELLADIGHRTHTDNVNFSEWGSYQVPPYDEQALLIETELLPKWFWPYINNTEPPDEILTSFELEWKKLLPKAKQKSPQIVMRDFHSPNLLWIPDRKGILRVGLIDTQDAVMGHAAYDLVSMIQDARVDISNELAKQAFEYYIALRKAKPNFTTGTLALANTDEFSETEFTRAYAILGAQRATKILGIFARLNKRDGKPAYLKHMPRVSRYLAHNLEHPALVELKQWYLNHLPAALAMKP